MRVGIDGTSWGSRRGYGRFLRNAGSRLVALDPETRYVFYLEQGSPDAEDLPEGAEVRTVAVGSSPREAARAGSRRTATDLARMALAVSRDRPDVFLFPSMHTYVPTVRVPTVIGVHDTIPEDYPELTHATPHARAYSRLKRWTAMRSATRIFTVSEASRRALVERFALDPEQLPIVPEAPDPVFYPRSADAVDDALAALDPRLSRGGFLVYAGGISPHKNIERLIEAYAGVAERQPDPPLLVVVGELSGDAFLSSAQSVTSLVRAKSLDERVLFPGFVSDEQLACLYSAAAAVAVPSLAEGFGLPAVEAAACGAALVLSDIPAHRETLDGSAVFVQPLDVADIDAGLTRVLEDPALGSSLAARALGSVSALSWDAAALALRDVLTAAAARRRARG
jgi:glycosyltransferase involved in cell wall biosynthesis